MRRSRTTACILLLVICSRFAYAQKLAQYSYGKYGTDGYEHLEFRVEPDKQEVVYIYG